MELNYDIIPVPKEIEITEKNKGLSFDKNISIFSNQPEIEKLLKVFKNDIKNVTSLDIEFSITSNEDANMIFEIQ